MNIGIMVYRGVEEQDFVGPLSVFSKANMYLPEPNRISRLAETIDDIRCANGTIIRPDYIFDHSPQLRMLIIPGGKGSREERYNPAVKRFVQEQTPKLEYLLTVCTGSLIAAEAGVLDGLRATTHHEAIPELEKYQKILVEKGIRFIRSGKIWSSAGVMAGIDASLAMLKDIYSKDLVANVRKRLEYLG